MTCLWNTILENIYLKEFQTVLAHKRISTKTNKKSEQKEKADQGGLVMSRDAVMIASWRNVEIKLFRGNKERVDLERLGSREFTFQPMSLPPYHPKGKLFNN